MRVGVSNACFYSRFYTEDAIKFLGENGVKTVEVFLDTKFEYARSFGSDLKNTLDKYSMTVSSIHAMTTQYEPQLFSISHRQQDDALEVFEQVLSRARQLGATKYIMHGQATLGGVLRNAQIPRIAKVANMLADIAKSYGQLLCWENVSWCIFNTPSFVGELLNECDNDNIAFCLDVKQAIRSGFEPMEFIDAMGDRLAHIHLMDYKKNNGKIELYMPGLGDMDYHLMAQKLRAMGYTGDLILECYSDLYKDTAEVLQSYQGLVKIFS